MFFKRKVRNTDVRPGRFPPLPVYYAHTLAEAETVSMKKLRF